MDEKSAVDLVELRKELMDYDPDRERCEGVIERRSNYAPDYMREDDPEYHDYDLVYLEKCCRAKGHSGKCRNGRRILGWPGRNALLNMISELEALRAKVSAKEG